MPNVLMSLLLLFFAGCAGPEGPAGATGPRGEEGAPGAQGSPGANGMDAQACSAMPNGDMTFTIICPNSPPITLVNGSPGPQGPAGAEGRQGQPAPAFLSRVRAEASGSACAHGGDRIDFGPDTNGNGVLDDGEVQQTAYACDGRSAPSEESEDGDSPPETGGNDFVGPMGIPSDGGLGDPCMVPSSMTYGFCADTTIPSNCETAGGTTHQGLCTGDPSPDVLCCTGRRCGPVGQENAGVCIPTMACNVSSGETLYMGLCPGPFDIQCCL